MLEDKIKSGSKKGDTKEEKEIKMNNNKRRNLKMTDKGMKLFKELTDRDISSIYNDLGLIGETQKRVGDSDLSHLTDLVEVKNVDLNIDERYLMMAGMSGASERTGDMAENIATSYRNVPSIGINYGGEAMSVIEQRIFSTGEESKDNNAYLSLSYDARNRNGRSRSASTGIKIDDKIYRVKSEGTIAVSIDHFTDSTLTLAEAYDEFRESLRNYLVNEYMDYLIKTEEFSIEDLKALEISRLTYYAAKSSANSMILSLTPEEKTKLSTTLKNDSGYVPLNGEHVLEMGSRSNYVLKTNSSDEVTGLYASKFDSNRRKYKAIDIKDGKLYTTKMRDFTTTRTGYVVSKDRIESAIDMLTYMNVIVSRAIVTKDDDRCLDLIEMLDSCNFSSIENPIHLSMSEIRDANKKALDISVKAIEGFEETRKLMGILELSK